MKQTKVACHLIISVWGGSVKNYYPILYEVYLLEQHGRRKKQSGIECLKSWVWMVGTEFICMLSYSSGI